MIMNPSPVIRSNAIYNFDGLVQASLVKGIRGYRLTCVLNWEERD